MATLTSTNATYLDVARRMNPNGDIEAIIEMLAENNAFVSSGVVMEGNMTAGHRTTQRNGLPSAAWRKLNDGVPNSKSTTVQVTDTCGMLETYSEVDKALADLNGNTAAFLASEDSAFLEAMSQTMETTTINGDTSVNPERFLGLAARYASLGTDPTQSSYNVIDASDQRWLNNTVSNDGSSIWFVTWGSQTTHYIYPKGSMLGWQKNFLGEDTTSGSSGQYQIYRTHYKWDLGLTVRDWRANARLANVKTGSALDSGKKIEEPMIYTMHRLRGAPGRLAIYMNEELLSFFDIRAQAKSNVDLTHGEWAGRRVLQFRGVPIFKTDAITSTESAIS